MTDSDFDNLCDRFDVSWQEGKPLRIEDLLTGSTEASRDKLLRALLEIELEYRIRSGDIPAVEDYTDRFPEQQSLLADALATAKRRIEATPNALGHDNCARVLVDRGDELGEGIRGRQKLSEKQQEDEFDDLKREFELAVSDSKRPRLIDFLSRVQEFKRGDLLRQLLEIEIRYRRRNGEQVEKDAYRKQFPEYLRFVSAAFASVSNAAANPFHGLPLTETYCEREHQEESTTWARPADQALLSDHFLPGISLNDRYVVERQLGRGGMGVVFLAHDSILDRGVAVKAILKPTGFTPALTAELDMRFRAEARFGAGLTHPAIASVYDFGHVDAHPYIVMEYLPGLTLAELLAKRKKLPLRDVREIAGTVAAGLDFANAKNLVHLDLKPANIKMGVSGEFKILDLGLASNFRERKDWRFAGTPAYASPEQASETACDGRADQYALAYITFELLTGRRLFSAETPDEILEMHRGTPPSFMATDQREIPKSVLRAIERSLNKDRSKRFDTCLDFAAAIGCKLKQFASSPTDFEYYAETEKAISPFTFGFSPLYPLLESTVYLAVTSDSLWTNDKGLITRIPLSLLSDVHQKRSQLKSSSCDLHLQFKRIINAEECLETLRSLRNQQREDDGQYASSTWTDVAVLRRRPSQSFHILGQIEAEGSTPTAAEAFLRIKCIMAGGEAVTDTTCTRLVSYSETRFRATGIPVKATTENSFQELATIGFQESVRAHSFRLTIASMGFALPSVFFVASDLRMPMPTEIGFCSAVLVIPVVSCVMLRVFRWPQLVGPVALALVIQCAVVMLRTGLTAGSLNPARFLAPLAIWLVYELGRLLRTRWNYRVSQAAIDGPIPRKRIAIAWSLYGVCSVTALLCLFGFLSLI